MPLASLYVCSIRSRTDTYYPWLREGKKTRIEKMCFGSIISSRGIPFLLEEERGREKERERERERKKEKRSRKDQRTPDIARSLQKRCRNVAEAQRPWKRVPEEFLHETAALEDSFPVVVVRRFLRNVSWIAMVSARCPRNDWELELFLGSLIQEREGSKAKGGAPRKRK